MKLTVLALLACLFSNVTAFAKPTVVLTCELSIVQDDEWEDCGTVKLRWPDVTREDSMGRGTGKCIDFKVNFHNFFADSGPRTKNEFALFVARETKDAEFAESSAMKFGNTMPPSIYLQPYFGDNRARAVACTSESVDL